MNGTYIIGVFADMDCTYQLTVVYEDKKILDVYAGSPHEIALEPHETIYL